MDKKLNISKIIFIYLLPPLFGIVLVAFFGVNAPFWDDWNNLKAYYAWTNSKTVVDMIFATFAQNNEHRILIPRLFTFPIMGLSHGNCKLLMYISQFFLYMTYLLFIKRLETLETDLNNKQSLIRDLLPSALVFMLIYSPMQWENMLWGFQIAWIMLMLFTVFGFYFFHKYIETGKYIFLVASCLLMILASFSSLQGLAIGIVYLLMGVIMHMSDSSVHFSAKEVVSYLSILIVYLVSIILYFRNYVSPNWVPDYDLNILKILWFYLAVSGTVVTPYFGEANGMLNTMTVIYGTVMGTVCTFFFVWVFILCIRRRLVRKYYFELSTILFCIGFRMMIALGRYGLGIGYLGAASRYNTFSLIAIAALVCIVRKEGLFSAYSIKNCITRKAITGCFALLLSCIMIYSIVSFYPCYVLKEKREMGKYCILHYEEVTSEDLKQYVGGTSEEIGRLEEQGFYPFYGQVD